MLKSSSCLVDDCQPKAAAGSMVSFVTGDVPECSNTMAAGSEQLEGIHTDAHDLPAYASGDVNPDIRKKRIDQRNDAFGMYSVTNPSAHAGEIPLSAITNTVDEECLMKLTRINDLLAEAAQLQTEVFG